jgi:hypothetical protein
VDISDRVSRETNNLARQSERLLPRLVFGVEVRAGVIRDRRKVVGLQRKQLLTMGPTDRSTRRTRRTSNPLPKRARA